MELNKRGISRTPKIRNPEGSLVNSRIPEIQLYLEASNLNIKEDKFYQSADEKLLSFIGLARASDDEYVLGLAKFMADNGLKLSPVVLLSVLSEGGHNFSTDRLDYIFNTPQRIAEAVAMGKIVRLNNSFKKNTLRHALENMSDYTLTKHQMKRRKIKTKDLIKLLRPRPAKSKNPDLRATLFKNIINGTAKFEAESFIRVKSNKELTDQQKLQYLYDNIDKLGINELIRNLKFITDNADFEQGIALQRKVLEKLQAVKDFRFLNIFDVIEAAIQVPQLERMLFEVVKNFTEKVHSEFDYPNDATILFDLSGSMEGEGINRGFKYVVLLSMIFRESKIRFFSDYLLNDKVPGTVMCDLIRKGQLQKAKSYLQTIGGTALLKSTSDLINEDKSIKNLIIVSDEVSWKEGSDLSYAITALSNQLKEVRTILINPVVYSGTVFKDNIMAFASLTSSIVYNVSLHINPQKFVKIIREYGKKEE